MQDTKVSLSLFPLCSIKANFNMGIFWDPIAKALMDAEDCGLEDQGAFSKMDTLFDRMKVHQSKKRSIASITWTISDNLKIGVQVFVSDVPSS